MTLLLITLLPHLYQGWTKYYCVVYVVFKLPFQDFCYENEPDTFNLLQVIDMCVTVVVYSPDSFRSVQMLVSKTDIKVLK